jgi:RNA polymerase sigma-70 factor (ECF subfamily)
MSVSALAMPTTGPYDRDGQLVAALRLRDESAVEDLVMTYQSRAYRLALGITGSAADAEEVVQDAFLAAIRKIDTFRGEAALGTWFYRIVVNGALGKVRCGQPRRMDLPMDEMLPLFDANGRHATAAVDWSGAVDDPARRLEVQRAVRSAIEELPAHYRAPLVMRDIEGFSGAEVGAALGLSVASVKMRVHRARLFIRTRLSESLA